MSNYRKLIVAAVGVLIMLGQRYGLDLSGSEGAIVDAVTAAATAIGVWVFPNTPAAAK